MNNTHVPQSWMDKSFAKYEGTFNGVPIYSPKKGYYLAVGIGEAEYEKMLDNMEGIIYAIDETKMMIKSHEESAE